MTKTEALQAINDLVADLETGMIHIEDLGHERVAMLKRLFLAPTTAISNTAKAQDAAEEIRRLSAALTATQTALSQAMQHAEKADRFVADVASLSIWGYDRDDGTPYQEIEEPDDENDSHDCLMGLIERARGIYETTSRKGEANE